MPEELSRNCFDVILQHDWSIEQCLLHIRVFFGGRTKSPCFVLSIHWLIKQTTNTYGNDFSRSYENRSNGKDDNDNNVQLKANTVEPPFAINSLKRPTQSHKRPPLLDTKIFPVKALICHRNTATFFALEFTTFRSIMYIFPATCRLFIILHVFLIMISLQDEEIGGFIIRQNVAGRPVSLFRFPPGTLLKSQTYTTVRVDTKSIFHSLSFV